MSMHRVLCCVLLGALVLAGCGPDTCVAGMSEGQRYHIELVMNYTTASPYALDDKTLSLLTQPVCAPPFGRAAGDSFDVKITKVSELAAPGESCHFWMGGPYALSGVGFGAEVTGLMPADAHEVMQTANEVSIAGCKGVLHMQLRSPTGGDIFAEPKAGEVPSLVLLYQLAMDAACVALPLPCEQLWVVKLTRA